MNQLSRPAIIHNALALSLIAAASTFPARAQAPQADLISSSSSYGLLDCFDTTAPPAPLPPSPAPARKSPHVETSLSLGAFAQLTAPRFQDLSSGDLVTSSMTDSAGVLGTFRQSFSPWLGYSVNMGFTRDSLHHTANATFNSANTISNFYIPASAYELSLSYVAEQHLTHRLTSFFDIGAGMLAFLPEHRGPDAKLYTPPGIVPPVDFRPMGVGGVGIDYHFNPSLALRAEYRGQLFKYPDYGGLEKLLTVSSQPTLSLTYTFGAKRR